MSVEIEDIGSVYDSMDAKALAAEQVSLRDQIEALEETTKELRRVYNYIRTNALPSRMETEGLELFRAPGIGRVSLRAELWAGIRSDVKNMAYQWMRDNGHGDIIVPYIHPSTFKAFAKDCLKQGIELPEDLFRIDPYTIAVITKK